MTTNEKFSDGLNEPALRRLCAPRRRKVLAALARVPEARLKQKTEVGVLVAELMRHWGDGTFALCTPPRSATYTQVAEDKAVFSVLFETVGEGELLKHGLKDTSLEQEVQVTPAGVVMSFSTCADDRRTILEKYRRQEGRLKRFIDEMATFVLALENEVSQEVNRHLQNAADFAVQAEVLAEKLRCPVTLSEMQPEPEENGDSEPEQVEDGDRGEVGSG